MVCDLFIKNINGFDFDIGFVQRVNGFWEEVAEVNLKNVFREHQHLPLPGNLLVNNS